MRDQRVAVQRLRQRPRTRAAPSAPDGDSAESRSPRTRDARAPRDTAPSSSASTTGDVDPMRVDVALVELAEPSAGRPIGTPDRLDLVALEEPRQLALVLRDDARERHREVVAQREVGLAARLVLAALEDLEDQLVAFFAVLARAASRCSRTPASRAARTRSSRTPRARRRITCSRRRMSSGRKSRVPLGGFVDVAHM